MSISFALDSSKTTQDSDNFEIDYYGSIKLDEGDWRIGLVNANLWYSWYNIAAAFNNNTLSYSYNAGVDWVVITIPDGNYQLTDIDAEIKRQMKANTHFNNADPDNPRYYITFAANFSTQKCRIELSNSYQVDLDASIADLLGFAAGIITSTTEGPDIVDITRGINTLSIKCSLVGQSYNNEVAGDILFQFVPDTQPGGNIALEPNERLYIPIRPTHEIHTIRMKIEDQLNRRVDFNGEPITYFLHLLKYPKI